MFNNETIQHLSSSSPSSLFQRIFTTIILASICLLGVIGNTIVLVVAIRKRNYRYVTNCYIINLAITDLLFLLISVPLTSYLGLTNNWILSGLLNCRIHIYLAHVLLQATCYTLAAMSIDRYFYVKSAHPRPSWRTPFNASIVCLFIWIVSIGFVFPYSSVFSSGEKLSNLSNQTNPSNLSNDCSVSSSHPLFAWCFSPFFALYILPLLIIILCYSRLCFHMRNIRKTIRRHRTSHLDCPRPLTKRRRVTRTLLSLTCAFAICWFPIHLLEMLNCYQVLDELYRQFPHILDGIRVLAHALSYSNSCLNPFLYALYSRDSFL